MKIRRAFLFLSINYRPVLQMEKFLPFLQSFIELSKKNLTLINAATRSIQFAKGELLLRQGDVCDRLLFLMDGKARTYYTDFTGKTFTWYFHFNDQDSTFKNLLALDYQSFITRQPTRLNIEALCDTTCIAITYADAMALQQQYYDFEKLSRLLSEQAYVATHGRTISLLVLSAAERYRQLLADEPYLLNKFANHQIASYLGITPQSLSRIRAQL
jgi:CRP-like cAMP-binding protein